MCQKANENDSQLKALYLLKPQSFMNVCGPAIARLGRRLHLGPVDLVIVFDDIDLSLGKVRVRMKGSAGGHNGVRSIIEALGTDELRRVKIGIGRPGEPGRDQDQVADHVLSPSSRRSARRSTRHARRRPSAPSSF